jgi:hypothetical protein
MRALGPTLEHLPDAAFRPMYATFLRQGHDDRRPSEHLVDAAYVSALLLVEVRERYGVDLVGPPRGDPNWQRRGGEGGEGVSYGAGAFEVDWVARRVRCPQGKVSTGWGEYEDERRGR